MSKVTKKARIAMIGLGGRGYGLLRLNLVHMKNVEVVGICDVYQDRIDKAIEKVKKVCGNTPKGSTNYKDFLQDENVDIIMITCAWEGHIDIAVEAMQSGKFVAMEVGGAYSVEDCWRLVDTYEQTKTPLMMLENCCYGEYELMTLRMVREGIFGDIVHCEGGYHHDLREEVAFGKENRHYRLKNYLERNCENYPTHEIGPIAKVLDINRGNLFTKLTSYSSVAKGLHEYILANKADDKELVASQFKQGDVVTTIIETIKGQTVVIQLDTTLPRPYSRGYTIRGTKAMYQEDNNLVFLDNKKFKMFDFNSRPLWNNGKKFAKKFAHRIWKNKGAVVKAGHGGMDSLVLNAMVEAFLEGYYPPIDVYDTATWMVITALSEQSIKNNNQTMEFPDFTRGKWKNRQDVCLGHYSLEGNVK
ncbi:MAG TPA: Gfo/Idh/MocA family oxidoreductase [Clostridia bacterium]|nr:Gfo/Idh/MocA family oxidoreductase [Clostridia bacterium]